MPRRAIPKSAGARRKRGSSGLGKSDRIKKHNALVDLYTAKRHLRDLKEISDSSSSDAGSDEVLTSDDEAENDLTKLRSLLGCENNAAANAEPTLEDVLGVKSKNSNKDAAAAADAFDVEADGDDSEDDEEFEYVEEEVEDFGSSAADPDDNNNDLDMMMEDEENPEMLFDVDELAELERMHGGGGGGGDADNEEATAAADAATASGLSTSTVQQLPEDDLFVAKYVNNVCGKPDSEAPLEGIAAVSQDMSVPPSAADAPEPPRFMNAVDARTQDDLNPECLAQASPKARRFLKHLYSKPSADAVTDPLLARRSQTELESNAFRLFSSYADVTMTTRTWTNARELSRAYARHCINHLFKSRAVTKANDAAIAAEQQQQNSNSNSNKSSGGKKVAQDDDEEEKDEEEEEEEENYRDRGFGNTRVLVLLPMRNAALRFIRDVCDLVGQDWESFGGVSSFVSDFSELEESKDNTFHRRPIDFQRQFEGNINDTFIFGVTIDKEKTAKLAAASEDQQQATATATTQKRSDFPLQLYMPFLQSEMIVASPLGLRKKLEKDGNLAVSLSSVEVLVVDEVQVMLMQSWAHVDAVMALLNRRPTTTTEGLNDMQRIYAWALEGQSRRHRQTLMISAFSHASLSRTMREQCCNNSGRIVVNRRYERGTVSMTPAGLRQHFVRMRVDGSGLDRVDDLRFEYFTRNLFPTKIRPLMEQNVRVILFVPSYFDFARLKAWLDDQQRNEFAILCEHSTQKEQRAALGQFSDAERCLLVMTERFYYFRRYFVKKSEVVFFYSPPVIDFFYADVLSRLQTDSPHASASTLFCRYDLHELNRVVGAERAQQMLTRAADSYMLVNK